MSDEELKVWEKAVEIDAVGRIYVPKHIRETLGGERKMRLRLIKKGGEWMIVLLPVKKR